MTKYITVNGHGAAWDMVHELAAAAFESLGIISSNGYSAGFSLDDDATKNAGYKVYRAIAYGYDLSDADAEKLYYNYVCDLGTALELNTCGADWSGITYYIRYIDEKQQEPQQEPEASATTAEGSAGETDDYIIRVSRCEAFSISMALLGVKWDHIHEAGAPDTSPDRRDICRSSARMWSALHDKVKEQIAAADARRENKREVIL